MNAAFRRALFAICAVAMFSAPSLAHAYTPTQSAAVMAKAKNDALAKARSAALIKAQSQATSKARTETIERARTLLRVKFAVQAETQRRVVAATKAAETNAAILSAAQPRFATTPPTRVNQLAMTKSPIAPVSAPLGQIRALTSHGATHGSGTPTAATHASASSHR